MKKIILGIIFLLMFTLTACNKTEALDYADFYQHRESSYYLAETESIGRYVLYVYNSEDESSANVKADILTFFDTFSDLDFYLLDTSNIESEQSSFENYDGEPVVYIVSSHRPLETYKGKEAINEFITKYSDIVYDYDLYESQHVTDITEITESYDSAYLVYFYMEGCGFCEIIKEDMLKWAFTRSTEDIYFINSADSHIVNAFPDDLQLLMEGTPQLVVMSKGQYADERYIGVTQISDFIDQTGADEITSGLSDFEYSDFADHFMDSYDDSLVISDNLHFEYYFSPYCSHCNSIKTEVLGFFDDNQDLEYYMLNIVGATGQINIEEFEGVPSLYLVNNNQVQVSYIGAIQISDFIEAYNNGEIDLTQYE